MSGFWQFVGWMLGLENLKGFESVETTLAAPWAQGQTAPAWIFFACVLLIAGVFYFYVRYQDRGSLGVRLTLAGTRSLLLILLLLFLFEPVLVATYTHSPRPLLWVLFDGTDSMNIADELSDGERQSLAKAVALKQESSDEKPTRADYVKALLQKNDGELLRRLREKFRLRSYVFDRPDAVRALAMAGESEDLNAGQVTSQLESNGQVTALGAALGDLGRRHSTNNLAAVLMFSDFDQNAGPAPGPAAQRLGVPIYTAGVGPPSALNLGVDLQAPLLMKKAERSTVIATLRQSGLDNKAVQVKVTARRLDGMEGSSESIVVGEKMVDLTAPALPVEFPFTPTDTGRFAFIAEVEKMDGEVVDQDNRAEREVNIRDDFLRLMYIENEPSWEWRFVKEVFHRDKLVGTRGFRTFLRSADPKVRQTNELFLKTLALPRSEFFAADVIFLGDMRGETLSSTFCEMLKEYVGTFGGGLVVIAGPQFGPGELAKTPLVDMLPVVVDPDARLRDERPFRMQLTPEALTVDFMNLGENEQENAKAWNNLGAIPWYQPVARPHPNATILAEHPTDTCVDGVTPQPLIAIRRYGRGEVIYLGFNETWRLRRKYGELYYRQFWGQMIHRLGLSHALGTQKRFVVRTDRQQYQADDKVFLTIEAYDENFDPLTEDKLPERSLTAELIVPDSSGQPSAPREIRVSQLREGVFETRIPVFVGGEHRARVKDPVTNEYSEVIFQVTSLSAERRSAVRNVSLEQQIAQATGGKNYELTNVEKFVDEVKLPVRVETSVEQFALWNTWFCFGLVIVLMFGEWVTRKLVNLP